MPKKYNRSGLTDTSRQKSFKSPYGGKKKLSTRAVKRIQKAVRAVHKSLSKFK